MNQNSPFKTKFEKLLTARHAEPSLEIKSYGDIFRKSNENHTQYKATKSDQQEEHFTKNKGLHNPNAFPWCTLPREPALRLGNLLIGAECSSSLYIPFI